MITPTAINMMLRISVAPMLADDVLTLFTLWITVEFVLETELDMLDTELEEEVAKLFDDTDEVDWLLCIEVPTVEFW